MSDTVKMQQFYLRDASGNVLQAGLLQLDHVPSAGAGQTLVLQKAGDPLLRPGRDTVDTSSGAVTLASTTAPTATVPNDITTRRIQAGFMSAALGSTLFYPSGIVDQMNMLHAAQVGGLLMVYDGSAWDLKAHTPEEGAEVLKDFVAARDTIRQSKPN